MRLFLLILIAITLSSCSVKPVYTVFFEEGNYTEFTTHSFFLDAPGNRKLNFVASRRCPGKTLCVTKEIKLTVRQQSKFAFLKGKDFLIKADGRRIDLNRRRYHFNYDIKAKAEDGTTGVSIERWVVWVPLEQFSKITNAEETSFMIGEYSFVPAREQLNNWRTLITHEDLLLTMEEEDQRVYGKYTETPLGEAEIRERFEKRAATEAEESTWELVKESEKPEDLRFFLEQYPESPFAVPARLRLKQLERKNTP